MANRGITDGVLITLCIQTYLSTGEGVTIATVAHWLQASKPTARKRMSVLVDSGLCDLGRSHYRANVKKIVYTPTQQAIENYERLEYRTEYSNWMALALYGREV